MANPVVATAPDTQAVDAVALLRAENHALELATLGRPTTDVLHHLAVSAEQLVGEGVLCSILLLDDSGQHLLHGAAPNLPEAYNAAIHGLQIGEGVGSCGTAAATAREVVVEDIGGHPYWAAFKDLALSHSLRACWSTPILSSNGKVLGTFAMYYRTANGPTRRAREVVALLSRTAGLVLERERNAARVSALNRTGLSLAAEHDLHAIVQTATDAAREVSGAAFGAFFYNVKNESGESYTLYTLSGVPREAFSRFPMPRNTAVFAPTFEGKGVMRSSDITADSRYGHNEPYHGMPKGHLPVRSYLAVPVSTRSGEVLGGMFFGHPEAGVFGDEEERLVVSIAAQAGIAMENARLHEQLTRELDEHVATTKRLKQAQQAANMATWEWDIVSNTVAFTPGSAEIFGIPIEELQKHKDGYAHVLEEDREKARIASLQAVERGENYQVEYRVKKDGDVRWILTRGHPVRDHEGKTRSVVGLSMDITERKAAELAKQEAESRFRLVLETSEVGFWYCDLPFSELIWDAKVKEHFWIPPDAPVTIDDFYARLHPDDRERTRAAIDESIQKNRPYDVDYRTVSPESGEHKWIRAVGRTFFDRSGHPVRFDGITMDVTDRKRSEDALRASEKLAATGRLAATIAHEINNPLEAVTNFIYLAKANPSLPEKVKRQLDIADQELARVTHIAQQTLGFYRDTTHPVSVDVNALVEDVTLIYSRKLSYKGIQLVRQLTPGLQVTGLQGELRQMVSNLLANAIDACDNGGTITFRTAKQNGGVRITVADNGTGMEPQTLSKLFTPFFTTKRDVGTGLGLWVTKGIIEKHGGSLRVKSAIGKLHGSAFSVYLPSQAEPAKLGEVR